MRYIKKQNEPIEFSNWKKKNKNANYNDLTPELKKVIKSNLLKEQYFLCCYCEKLIGIENSTIEHLQPIHHNSKKQLVFNNFLASCDTQNTCNLKRGHKKIKLTPLQKDIESKFLYYLSFIGKNPIIKIEGDEETIAILNLNDNQLSRKRGKVYFGVKETFNEEWTTGNVQKLVHSLSNPNEEGKLQEFVSSVCHVFNNSILK